MILTVILLMVSSALTIGAAEIPSEAVTRDPSPAAWDDLTPLLTPLRETNGLPALAAAVVRDGKIVAAGAIGVRRVGSEAAVTLADKFHIGSCTKSMTATLAAMLVEEGKLAWTNSILEIFPELDEAAKPAWREATLELLLGHRAGAPAAIATELWKECRSFQGPPEAHRLLLVTATLRDDPESRPGTRYSYSNSSYAFAGAMIERRAERAWENLLMQRLFRPLGLASTGYGPPATPGQEDQPWGHLPDADAPRPIPSGPLADNPPSIGPAGTVHCSVLDLARYAAFHLTGKAGAKTLLSRESLRKLHTTLPGQGYALGWDTAHPAWAGGPALTHTGSNTMFWSLIWIAPAREFAVVVATNLGGETAAKACDQTAAELIRTYLPPQGD